MELGVNGDVLVVDDDEEFRNQIKAWLEQYGATVVALDSASAAVRFLQNQTWTWRPGLLITDLVMDGMGGYQFIRRFKELFKDGTPPVIVMSKLCGGSDVGEAEFAGASGYLTKPFQDDSLFHVIQRICSENPKRIVVYTKDSGVRVLNR